MIVFISKIKQFKRLFTSSLSTASQQTQSLGSGQQMMLQLGQTLLPGHLHTRLVLLLGESRTLAKHQHLQKKKRILAIKFKKLKMNSNFIR